MKSYTIHLIRHGITEGNLLGQYIGRTDSPLAAEGIRALQKLKEQYEYPEAQAYYCSPMRRCIDTLRILYPEAEPVLVDGFRECDFGDWEGKTAKQLAEEDPSFLQWMESSHSVAPPNGESTGVLVQRTCAAFENLVEELMRSGTTSAVVVAHGGTLMSILSAYGLPRASFYDWMTENGCGAGPLDAFHGGRGVRHHPGRTQRKGRRRKIHHRPSARGRGPDLSQQRPTIGWKKCAAGGLTFSERNVNINTIEKRR